jgi:tRNA pseudouridine38-40 synthase
VTEEPSVRLRLDIAYDGTDFNGWAKQPGQRTVQGELERALETVLGRHGPVPRLAVAGRTDAGVHATGQVAHVDLTEPQVAALMRQRPPRARELAPGALGARLNGIAGLKSDVVVSRTTFAPKGFDARFSASWRRYEYRIADAGARRDPLLRRHTIWYPAELEVAAMDTAARELAGLHDWAAYCRPREGATTIRELQEFSWSRGQDGVLTARLRADAFCHSMVRALVGATVAVGERKLEPARVIALRDEAARTNEFKVMPAAGLTLVEVGYPPETELAARAAMTRARRDAAPDEIPSLPEV